ncbi:glycosyl hydrolase family 18 protein [Paenibacillus thalictri]|uniref:chitinase n=1 Tax=Paenibacillus thalictri TaxID=2527873 RepID=A0A4Q9DU51_9BACL|nr:glycosyl hydrolase family 18 protein [Paenibacillus thalictri]TBL79390.1 glycoside hydrolase [Paenibacillus thalictri]
MYKKMLGFAVMFLFATAGNAYAYDVPMFTYKDVAEQAWEKDYVYTLSALGIIEGYPDSRYHSEDALSREAFIKLLVTTAKLDISHASGTVPADAADRWSTPYIAAASERHWIEFMVNKAGELKPEQQITREEVAAVVGKYLLDKAGMTGSQWLSGDWTKERDKRAFVDISKMDANLAPYVFYTVNRTVMEGDTQGFRPKSGLTRSEAAAVIYRLIDMEAAEKKLEVTGFYAIKSSPAIGRMPIVDKVVMGWSHLEYDTAGTAKLGTDTTTYKVPDGYADVVKSAEQAHVQKELMVFYNDGKKLSLFLQDGPAQKAFIGQLVTKLGDPAFGFSGVSLDFEGLMDASDAPNYLQFVRNVKAAIGSKTLTVSVPTDYYYKGYDLKGLGETADSLNLMAYDFTHDDSKLPSAPLPLVRDGVERALRQGVPASKLVLGISKQANQWITTNDKVTTAEPGIDLVEKRLADPEASKTWTMPYFLKLIQYQVGDTANQIYYEDTQSIAKKIWLAKVYNLKGISLWHMGNFTASDWDTIEKR